jgi:chromosome segregation ATPase
MRHLTSFLVLLAGCLAIFPGLALGQSNKPAGDDQTLRSLIKEVHELRLTLQRTNLLAYRSQITVGRIRAERERIDRVARQLESVRDEIAGIELEIPRMADRLKDIEADASAESSDERRKGLEAERKDLKARIDQHKQRDAQLHEREVQLSTELTSERAKLDDLDYRVEALDRELEDEAKRERSADNTKQDQKQP